jgi:hypothetical protein
MAEVKQPDPGFTKPNKLALMALKLAHPHTGKISIELRPRQTVPTGIVTAVTNGWIRLEGTEHIDDGRKGVALERRHYVITPDGYFAIAETQQRERKAKQARDRYVAAQQQRAEA